MPAHAFKHDPNSGFGRRDYAPLPSRNEPGPAPAPKAEPDAEPVVLPAAEAEDRRGPLRPRRLISSRVRLGGRSLATAFRGADAAATGLLAWAACEVAHPQGLLNTPVSGVLPFLLGAVALIVSLRAVRAYDFSAGDGLGRHLMQVTAAFVLTGAVMAAAFLPFAGAESETVRAIAFWFCMSFAAIYMLHVWWWASVRRRRRSGALTPTVVIVGATENARRFIEKALETREVNILGVFDDRAAGKGKRGRPQADLMGVPVLGDVEALLNHRVLPYVDKIVIAVTSSAQGRVRDLIGRLRVLPNAVSLFLDIDGQDLRAATLSRLADAPLAQVTGKVEDERRAFAKRVQDLVVGSLALVLAAPVMAGIAIAIKLDSPGPVLFRQRRHGFNNEAIVVWKFRSMRADAADATASRQVSADDDRVTRVGKLIRRTSMDELPQILNVLKGEMSLVGPRPHAIGMMTGDEESARLVAEYAHRHRIKPGITGWAAIKGSRGPVDTPEQVRNRVALDVEYIERQSFWLDLWIMVMTIPCLLGDRRAVR